jgi:isocitrate dehydrogenase
LAGSANIGEGYAMFEAIHGSAPRRAGQNLGNPSGLLLGAVQMLVHIGQGDIAAKVHNAWLKTMEDGVHTYDIFKEDTSKEKVGTKEFGDAVIARLGQVPSTLKTVEYIVGKQIHVKASPTVKQEKQILGVDVFLHWTEANGEKNANVLGDQIVQIKAHGLELSMISNRGLKVYPNGFPETFCTDHWRCRYTKKDDSATSNSEIIDLLTAINKAGFDIAKTENLCTFGGIKTFSMGQGE